MFRVLACAALLTTVEALSVAPIVAANVVKKSIAEPIVITSQGPADYDFKNHKARLTGGVQIRYKDMELSSETADAVLDENNQVRAFIATTDVVIKRDGAVATCGRVSYDAESDWLVLTEKPVLRQGSNLMQAPVIRYSKTEGRAIGEGGTTIKILPVHRDDEASKANHEQMSK